MKTRKGVSTILVVFMVVILVTFGLFSIASANVNNNLSEKSSEWANLYYNMDNKAENEYMEVESVLIAAESYAVDYITNEKYLLEAVDDPYIDPTIQSFIYNAYLSNPNQTELYKILNMVYRNTAKIMLNEYSLNFLGEASVEASDDTMVESLKYFNNIYLDDTDSYYLSLEFEVKDILYQIVIDENGYTGQRVPGDRLNILSWTEIQTPQDIQGEELWQPFDIEEPIAEPGEENLGNVWIPDSN